MEPITLWEPYTAARYDDGGVLVMKSQLPRSAASSCLYKDMKIQTTFHNAPRLQFFCLRALLDSVEDMHVMGHMRLLYSRNEQRDFLRLLVPTWGTPHFSLLQMHPKMWALLVQLYDDLPEDLQTYPMVLDDPHLPLLQKLPSTDHFSLITILNLRGSKAFVDENIVALKPLHTLSALDASSTKLTAEGIRRLSQCLSFNEEDKRGPWALRILRLRRCVKIGNGVFEWIIKFPLLCAVDLRGTMCTFQGDQCCFQPASSDGFFEPSSLLEAVDHLDKKDLTTFSRPNPFIINVQEKPFTVMPDKARVNKTVASPMHKLPAKMQQDKFFQHAFSFLLKNYWADGPDRSNDDEDAGKESPDDEEDEEIDEDEDEESVGDRDNHSTAESARKFYRGRPKHISRSASRSDDSRLMLTKDIVPWAKLSAHASDSPRVGLPKSSLGLQNNVKVSDKKLKRQSLAYWTETMTKRKKVDHAPLAIVPNEPKESSSNTLAHLEEHKKGQVTDNPFAASMGQTNRASMSKPMSRSTFQSDSKLAGPSKVEPRTSRPTSKALRPTYSSTRKPVSKTQKKPDAKNMDIVEAFKAQSRAKK